MRSPDQKGEMFQGPELCNMRNRPLDRTLTERLREHQMLLETYESLVEAFSSLCTLSLEYHSHLSSLLPANLGAVAERWRGVSEANANASCQ
jgi:hypothetical protein